MAIYIIDVFITTFLSMFIIGEFDEKGIETNHSKKKKNICLFLILITWVLIYSFRGLTGTDSINYFNGLKKAAIDNYSLLDCISMYRDWLYGCLVYFSKSIAGNNWFFLCFLSSLIIYIPIISIIHKKSDDITISCLLYVLSLNAFFGFNGLRQALSSSLVLFAYYFGLREKKFIKYTFFMIIAFGFHAGTLLVIPFHLLSIKKIKAFSTYLLIAIAFLSVFFLESFWNDFIGIFQGDNLVSSYADMFGENAHGSGFLRVIVAFFPVLLSFPFYQRMQTVYQDIDHDILMLLFGALFMLYSMKNVSFSQMFVYFSQVNIVFMPKLLNTIKDTELKFGKVIRYAVIIAFFLYMVILLNHGDMGLNPYIPYWKWTVLK